MKKLVIALIVIFVIAAVVVYFLQNKSEIEQEVETTNENNIEEVREGSSLEEFIQCLADSDVVIYGSATCPACQSLASKFGGYEAIQSLYVECNDERARCQMEMQTEFVPEIQIGGELFRNIRELTDFAAETGCEL